MDQSLDILFELVIEKDKERELTYLLFNFLMVGYAGGKGACLLTERDDQRWLSSIIRKP